MALAVRAADEAVLATDRPFRSALSGFLEWRSRASGATAPRWDWGRPARARPRLRARLRPDPAPAPTSHCPVLNRTSVTLPGPDETVSFAAHVKPLFREHDRKSMTFAFDLWSQADVQAHAAGILERLRNGTMPCDGAWPQEKIEVFRRWTESGFQP